MRNGGNRIAAAASAYGKEAVVERQQRILALFSLSENPPGDVPAVASGVADRSARTPFASASDLCPSGRRSLRPV